ncbi:MAG: nucleoside deaminase [Phycisphaera sp.]|nr:nucleoside deaminase [Phycisphaera sp.]
MRLALDACRVGVAKGQSPFGACIVRDGEVLASTHNHVWLNTDPTAHAEVICIREACHRIKSIHLPGATIYSTTEPCPMCFTAIHWARIDRIVYSARVEDADQFGFNELKVTNQQLKTLGGTGVQLVPDFLRAEALEIYRNWQSRSGQAY